MHTVISVWGEQRLRQEGPWRPAGQLIEPNPLAYTDIQGEAAVSAGLRDCLESSACTGNPWPAVGA